MKEPLSKADKQEIGSILLDAARAGAYLANSAIGVETPQGSPAGVLQQDSLNSLPGWWRGNQPVRRAHEDVLITSLAGFDHMRCFVSTIRGPQDVAVSFASLARGGVEAFSRAYFLLNAKTANELLARHSSLALDDIKYTVKHNPGDSLSTWDRGNLDAALHERTIQDGLNRLGEKKVSGTDKTSLATALLDYALHGGGRVAYSQLSSVAHGESFAINHFLRILTDEEALGGEPNISFVMPRDVAVNYAIYLLTCRIQTSLKIIETFEPHLGAKETWESAHERVNARMNRLDRSRRRSGTEA